MPSSVLDLSSTTSRTMRDPFRKIKGRLKARGMTLGDIAAIAGTTRQPVSDVAHGRSKSKRLRLAICQALGFEPKDLGWNKPHNQRRT